MHLGLSLLTLFPGRVGGSESYVRGLLGEFADGRGPDRVTVLANRHVTAAYDAYARGPVRLHEVSSYRAGEGMLSRALAMAGARLAPGRAARDVPAGLDLLHYAVTVPIPALPIPSVVTVHDVSHLDERGLRSLPLRRYRRWAYDGAARAADAVVATSAFARGRIVDGMGVDPDRVEVIAPGIDHAIFTPEPVAGDEARLAGMGVSGRFVLYPANLWAHKNHYRLVEAIARVDDDDLGLVLAGQAYGRWRALAARAARLGIESRVRHVGQLDPPSLAALYRRAEATVIPSLHEGFGFPALEAMACACPVASSGRGALAEVSASASVLFDPEELDSIASAIEQAVARSPERDRRVAEGRELAGAYTWSDCARRHVEVYSRLG